jgi:hypothetical protein
MMRMMRSKTFMLAERNPVSPCKIRVTPGTQDEERVLPKSC